MEFPGGSQEGLGMSKEYALGDKHEILAESISWYVYVLEHRHNISEKSHKGMSLLCNDCIYRKKLKRPGEWEIVSQPDYTHIHFEGQQAALRKTKLPLSPYREEYGPFLDVPDGELGLLLSTAVKWPCMCDFYLLFQQSPRR